MTRLYWIFIVILGTLFSWEVHAVVLTEQDIREQIMAVIEAVLAGEVLPDEYQTILNGEPDIVLRMLREFEQHESSKVRFILYDLEVQLAYQDISPELQRNIIERLTWMVCFEHEDGIPGIIRNFADVVGTSDDFTEQAKAWIRERLTTKQPRSQVILLSGIADLQDQIPRLKALRADDEDYAAIADDDDEQAFLIVRGWQARLALARLGSQEDIQHCIQKIETSPDFVVRVTYLLQQYGYIRQPDTIKRLQYYLEKDDLIDGRTPCGVYARDILVDIVEGFPINADLATARAWMQAQTEFKIKR